LRKIIIIMEGIKREKKFIELSIDAVWNWERN